MSVSIIVGNPRHSSRTLAVATNLGSRLARLTGDGEPHVVDLALFGPRLFDPEDVDVLAALASFQSATIAIVASPTYKASFSGLLKLFLDRIPAGALSDVTVVPLMTGGAPHHSLAVDVHLRPVLLELGARMPTQSLFIAESQLPEVDTVLDSWERIAAPALAGVSGRQAIAGR